MSWQLSQAMAATGASLIGSARPGSAADRARSARTGAHRSRSRWQICRPPSALSPGRDLRLEEHKLTGPHLCGRHRPLITRGRLWQDVEMCPCSRGVPKRLQFVPVGAVVCMGHYRRLLVLDGLSRRAPNCAGGGSQRGYLLDCAGLLRSACRAAVSSLALVALGQAPSISVARAEILEVQLAPNQTIRELCEQYLGDPDLWPEILKASNLASVAELAPGVLFRVPVDLIAAADRAVARCADKIRRRELRWRAAFFCAGGDRTRHCALRSGSRSSHRTRLAGTRDLALLPRPLRLRRLLPSRKNGATRQPKRF